MDDPPTEHAKDKMAAGARALVKGAVGAVPVAGSFLSEVVDLLYRAPIEQRREEWLRELTGALSEVQERQDELTPERLASNPEFVTVLHQVTEVAIRTHLSEKREQLRNVVVHAALPTAPELDKQLFFVRLVEDLTLNQVLILTLYRDPRGWFAERDRAPKEFMSAGRDQVVKQAYPELANSEFFDGLVVGDLVRRGLLNSLGGMVTGGSVYDRMTSPLADQFLDYISRDA